MDTPIKPRIEREKKVVRKMIELYCRHNLHLDHIPQEYIDLAEYACRRLDYCKFGEKKTACKKCPIHCYAPHHRERIRAIMRWAGPRMLIYDPIAAIRHLLNRKAPSLFLPYRFLTSRALANYLIHRPIRLSFVSVILFYADARFQDLNESCGIRER